MKMFEKDGSLHLVWKAGSGVMIRGHGHTADTLLALASGIKEVIEFAMPPEDRIDCAKKLTELLLDMMNVPAIKISFDSTKGDSHDERFFPG